MTPRPSVHLLLVPHEEVVRRGVLCDSVAFLQKPFTPLTLARKVREVLSV